MFPKNRITKISAVGYNRPGASFHLGTDLPLRHTRFKLFNIACKGWTMVYNKSRSVSQRFDQMVPRYTNFDIFWWVKRQSILPDMIRSSCFDLILYKSKYFYGEWLGLATKLKTKLWYTKTWDKKLHLVFHVRYVFN